MRMCNKCFYSGVEPVKIDPMSLYSNSAITRAVCTVLEIPIQDLQGKLRDRETSDARKIYSILCTSLTRMSLKRIGRTINQDHSSVIFQRDSGRDLLKTDQTFYKKYIAVKHALKPIYE